MYYKISEATNMIVKQKIVFAIPKHIELCIGNFRVCTSRQNSEIIALISQYLASLQMLQILVFRPGLVTNSRLVI